MIETGEILQTMRMIQEENFDIRTITLGINLLDCSYPDGAVCARRVYDKICRVARDLVRTGEEIEREFSIPIVNKRISVTPVSLICQGDPRPIAQALDKAAKEMGVNFLGGYSAQMQKGATAADERLLVHLSCGDASFDILGLSADDFPELPEVDDEYSVCIEQKVLKAMIGETSFAVSTNESRPVHTGSLFEIGENGLTVVSVDGFRLAYRRETMEKSAGAFTFITPGTALNEVKNICGDTEDPVSITLGRRHILFEIGSTELICRRLEGEFLDYKNAIPRKNPISLTVDTKTMIESLERVSVVISEKLKSPVRCLFSQNKVTFSAKTASGEAKDICKIEGDGRELEIGFNNRYLTEALRYAPADTVKLELNSGISPAIVVPVDGGESFLYMVLPVRLKA